MASDSFEVVLTTGKSFLIPLEDDRTALEEWESFQTQSGRWAHEWVKVRDAREVVYINRDAIVTVTLKHRPPLSSEVEKTSEIEEPKAEFGREAGHEPDVPSAAI